MNLFSKTLLAISIAILADGCCLIQCKSESPRQNDEARYLREVAEHLGMHVPTDRKAVDIASDIRLYLDGAVLRAPAAPSEELTRQLKDVITEAELKSVTDADGFLKKLKGRKVLVLSE